MVTFWCERWRTKSLLSLLNQALRAVVYTRTGTINFYENCEISVGLRADLPFLVLESSTKNIFEYNDNMNAREELCKIPWWKFSLRRALFIKTHRIDFIKYRRWCFQNINLRIIICWYTNFLSVFRHFTVWVGQDHN